MVIEWIVGTAAVIVALLVIIKFGYATYKAIHRIERLEYQLFPNGGRSLDDRVTQVAFDQKTIEGEVRSIRDALNCGCRT